MIAPPTIGPSTAPVPLARREAPLAPIPVPGAERSSVCDNSNEYSGNVRPPRTNIMGSTTRLPSGTIASTPARQAAAIATAKITDRRGRRSDAQPTGHWNASAPSDGTARKIAVSAAPNPALVA